jgi:hypothetical protein
MSDLLAELGLGKRAGTPPALGHFVSKDELYVLQLTIEKGLGAEALAIVKAILARRPRFPLSSEVE